MKKHWTSIGVAALQLLAAASLASSAEKPAPGTLPALRQIIEIIDKEGEFIFTDGSSYYRFHRGGTFELRPVQTLGGRIIEGKWTNDKSNPSILVIDGQWRWLNGMSALNDQRRMRLALQAPFALETILPKHNFIPKKADGSVLVYPGYFVIEELVEREHEK